MASLASTHSALGLVKKLTSAILENVPALMNGASGRNVHKLAMADSVFVIDNVSLASLATKAATAMSSTRKRVTPRAVRNGTSGLISVNARQHAVTDGDRERENASEKSASVLERISSFRTVSADFVQSGQNGRTGAAALNHAVRVQNLGVVSV